MFVGASIHDAAKTGNLERIKELIQVVPEMKNKTDERGMNPLHIAAANGRLDCVKWLAVSGVDLAGETPTGYTAMHLAAMNGHVNCMMVSSKGKLYSLRMSSKISQLLLPNSNQWKIRDLKVIFETWLRERFTKYWVFFKHLFFIIVSTLCAFNITADSSIMQGAVTYKPSTEIT